MKNLNKKIGKMDMHNLALTKLSIIAGVLFVLNIWPSAMNWVASVHWGWFLAAAIIFAIIPFKKVCK